MDLDTTLLIAIWGGFGFLNALGWWWINRTFLAGFRFQTLTRVLVYLNMVFLVLTGPLGSLTLGPVALGVYFCYSRRR